MKVKRVKAGAASFAGKTANGPAVIAGIGLYGAALMISECGDMDNLLAEQEGGKSD